MSAPNESHPRQDWIFGLILFVVTLLAYQSAWNGKPIWDDEEHITKPELRSVEGLRRIWTEPGASQQYYPLTHSVFWVEHRLWGDATIGYHLVNILLHAFSALLLAKTLRRIDVPGAWLAAAIFALHPVQVESIAWISELKNTLSGVFYLSAALAYLRFESARRPTCYAFALGLFLLGLMSKTVVATLPVTLFLIIWWKRKTWTWKRDVVPLLPFFGAGLGFGLFTAWMERIFFTALTSGFNFSVLDRILIAGRAIWFYLGKLFWPVNLTFIYPRWNISPSVWWQYLFPAAVLLTLGVLWWQRTRWRALFVGAIFFPITLFPALGFVNVYPFRFSFVADHFQYLATIGPIALVSGGVTIIFDRLAKKRLVLEFISGALLPLLAVLTWRQGALYADSETLWKTTIARNPSSWMAYNNLGATLHRQGRVNEEIACYEEALRINPSLSEAHTNLAMVLQANGRRDEAIAHYNEALNINPNDAAAHNNLGIALDEVGQSKEAIAHYRQAVMINPRYAAAYNNLGLALQGENGQLDEAAGNYRKALEIEPNYAEAHYNLGNALHQAGRLDEAIAQYNEALKIKPDYAEARNNLELVLQEREKRQNQGP